jgi:hypothetical protein
MSVHHSQAAPVTSAKFLLGTQSRGIKLNATQAEAEKTSKLPQYAFNLNNDQQAPSNLLGIEIKAHLSNR